MRWKYLFAVVCVLSGLKVKFRVGLLIANWLYFVNVSCYAFGVTTAAFAEGPLCTQGLIHQAVA